MKHVKNQPRCDSLAGQEICQSPPSRLLNAIDVNRGRAGSQYPVCARLPTIKARMSSIVKARYNMAAPELAA